MSRSKDSTKIDALAEELNAEDIEAIIDEMQRLGIDEGKTRAQLYQELARLWQDLIPEELLGIVGEEGNNPS